MLEHLFGSQTRLKLIRMLFKNPDKPFFVRELTRILNVQINAIRRELETLSKAGIIKESEQGEENSLESSAGLRKYYVLDTASLIYPELKALLLKDQIIGEQEFIQEIKERVGDIKLLLVSGQFTGDKRAPTDMLIVGSIKEKVLARMIADHEQEFGFEIRYTTMSEKEFLDRRHVMDKFLYTLFEAEHVKVVNVYNNI